MQLDTHLTVRGLGGETYSVPPFDADPLAGRSMAKTPAAKLTRSARERNRLSLSSEDRGLLGGTRVRLSLSGAYGVS
jgi:hypothetical protein